MLQQHNTQIILCLDNNEELRKNLGQQTPLTNAAPKPTVSKKKDGMLELLILSTGLVDTLSFQHPSPSYPSTYIQRRKCLNYILVSSSLCSTIQRSGVLPYNSLFLGDHQPCYIGIDTVQAFQSTTTPLAPPCQRQLQLADPRVVNRYIDALHVHLDQHKILQKIEHLKEHAKQSTWSETITHQYE